MNKYFLFFYLAGSVFLFADISTVYVTGQATDVIYEVNVLNGSHSTIVPSPSVSGAELCGIALNTPNSAYVTGLTSNIIYSFNITNGADTQLVSIPNGGLDRLALASNQIGYVTGFWDGNLYQVNLTNGSFSNISSLGGSNAGIALNLGLQEPDIAWVINSSLGIQQVNLKTGILSTAIPAPGINLRGIALMNNQTAYAVALNQRNIYRVDLTTGAMSIVATLPLFTGGLESIFLANANTAYVTAGFGIILIYKVDLASGNFSHVATINQGTATYDIASWLQIGTQNLTGNNLRFANYLNENASFRVIPLFALQNDMGEVLQSAIPTRNAIFTFAAQTTQLAFGGLVNDHIVQKTHPMSRGVKMKKTSSSEVNKESSLLDSLLASSKDQISSAAENQPEEIKKNYSTWLGTFGQYTRQKAQLQTPSFEADSAGAILAVDYFQNDWVLMGSGLAYGYTHVHEGKKAGHANINQGAMALYFAFYEDTWSADAALWGGYYHANNVRVVVIPEIAQAEASGKTHGWQLTPHFTASYKNYPFSWFIVESFNRIDWVACWEDGFEEQGAGFLNMGQKSRFCSLLRNELGFRFHEILQFAWGEIRFFETLGYMYQKTLGTGTIQAFLVGSPSSFTVSTLTGAQNLGAVEFEALFIPGSPKYPYGTISYQGEFGSSYQVHSASLSLGVDF